MRAKNVKDIPADEVERALAEGKTTPAEVEAILAHLAARVKNGSWFRPWSATRRSSPCFRCSIRSRATTRFTKAQSVRAFTSIRKEDHERLSNRAQLLFSRRARVLGLFADILDYPAPGLARKAAECAALIGAGQPGRPRCWRASAASPRRPRSASFRRFYSGFFDLNSICHPYVGYQLFGELPNAAASWSGSRRPIATRASKRTPVKSPTGCRSCCASLPRARAGRTSTSY